MAAPRPIDGLLKVRAITRFVVLDRDRGTWDEKLSRAAALCVSLAADYATLGFETQTLRIVTNPFGEYLDTASAAAALGGLAALAAAAERAAPGPIRVRLAVGAATSASELALVPAMIRAHGDL